MEDTTATLQANLQALMKHRGLTIKGVVELAKKMNLSVSNGTVGRVHAGVYVGTAKLEGLAATFGLRPWQFMVPDLDPTNPPMLATESTKMRKMLDTIRKTNEAISGALRDDGNTKPSPLDAPTNVTALGQQHRGVRRVTPAKAATTKARTKGAKP